MSGFIANSYSAKDIVDEEVSKPPVKKMAACATRSSPSNSEIHNSCVSNSRILEVLASLSQCLSFYRSVELFGSLPDT